MGFSHERRAAVLTILRARAIGDAQVIEDAESAASGYLDMEDFDEYAGYHAPEGLTTDDPVIALLHERDHFRNAAIQAEHEIHDILAGALGYPLFQPGEPGHAEGMQNHITGDHVAASLAREAATRIVEMERVIDEAGL